jgi:sulfite reductase (NADPH) hemoprotein beta-component
MKYTVDDMTPAGFKAATEELLKYKFEAERPYKFERNIDTFGWQTGYDGKKHFTCFIENGRVQDEPGKDFRTGLREIAKVLKEEGGVFRLTANQVSKVIAKACMPFCNL